MFCSIILGLVFCKYYKLDDQGFQVDFDYKEKIKQVKSQARVET
jgi:hypothetical protein